MQGSPPVGAVSRTADATQGRRRRIVWGGATWCVNHERTTTLASRTVLDAGFTKAKHPGHPCYFMVPGG